MIVDFGFLPSLIVFAGIIALLVVGVKITSGNKKGDGKSNSSNSDSMKDKS